MEITKIKYDGKQVHIEWEVMKGDVPESFMIQSCDQPTDKFKQALQSLAEDVAQILNWPDEYARNTTVRGVSLSYGGESRIMAVIITAMKPVKTAKGPFIFNTPLIPETATPPQAPHLSPTTVKAVQRLIAEAKNYVKGIRAQVEIFEKDRMN